MAISKEAQSTLDPRRLERCLIRETVANATVDLVDAAQFDLSTALGRKDYNVHINRAWDTLDKLIR